MKQIFAKLLFLFQSGVATKPTAIIFFVLAGLQILFGHFFAAGFALAAGFAFLTIHDRDKQIADLKRRLNTN